MIAIPFRGFFNLACIVILSEVEPTKYKYREASRQYAKNDTRCKIKLFRFCNILAVKQSLSGMQTAPMPNEICYISQV